MMRTVVMSLVVCTVAGCNSCQQESGAPSAQPAASQAPSQATAPASTAPEGKWGQVLSEKVENGILSTSIQSPWGPVSVEGPVDGVEGAVTRYWVAWAKVDFEEIYALAGGDMKARLENLDNDAGHKEYRDTIAGRYKENPPVWFRVEGIAENGPGKVVATVRNQNGNGEEQTRKCYLEETPEGWKFTLVQVDR